MWCSHNCPKAILGKYAAYGRKILDNHQVQDSPAYVVPLFNLMVLRPGDFAMFIRIYDQENVQNPIGI